LPPTPHSARKVRVRVWVVTPACPVLFFGLYFFSRFFSRRLPAPHELSGVGHPAIGSPDWLAPMWGCMRGVADPSDTPAVQQPRQARTGQPLFGCLGVVCSRPPGNGTDLFARLACGVAASSAGLPEPGPGLASPGAAAAASAPGRMQLNFGHPRVVATLSHAQHDKHKSHARVAVALTWLSL